MNLHPIISIITPVWNGLPFLKECIGSVLSQNFEEWEMLISDDGSTDGSREYLDSITDPRIRVFKQQYNLGIFGNLNFLFAQAKSYVSQILCQDDYFIRNNSLSTIVQYWQNAPDEVGFVRFNHSSPTSSRTIQFQKKITPHIVTKEKADLWFFVFGNVPGNLSNVSLRTKIVAETGYFKQDLPYAGDFDFWSRAARMYDMGVQQEMVVYVRRHAGVASNFLNKKGELLNQKAIIIEDLYTRLKTRFPKNKQLLKLQATLNYDVLQRDTGIIRLLKGDGNYLRVLNSVHKNVSYSYNLFLCWLLFIISIGGRFIRTSIAKRILNRLSY